MRRVIVVGGGAAGMMAAISAAQSGAGVLLLEKNEKLGKKLYITGKGRCNITNDSSTEELLDHVVTNRKFLYSAFYGFSSQDMQEFLESRGLPLKTERGNRVFPASDRASDVTACLAGEMARLGVEVRLRSEVSELILKEDRVLGVLLRDGSRESSPIRPPAPTETATGLRKKRDIR